MPSIEGFLNFFVIFRATSKSSARKALFLFMLFKIKLIEVYFYPLRLYSKPNVLISKILVISNVSPLV